MLRQLTVLILLFQISAWGLDVRDMDSACHVVQKVCCCDTSGESNHQQQADDCDGCMSCLARENTDTKADWPDLGTSLAEASSSLIYPEFSTGTLAADNFIYILGIARLKQPSGYGGLSRAILASWLN